MRKTIFMCILCLLVSAGARAADLAPPPKDLGLLGIVKIIPDDTDWSVYHFRAGGLFREVRFIMNNVKRRDVTFAWNVLDDAGITGGYFAKTDASRNRETIEIPVKRNGETVRLTATLDGKTYLLDTEALDEPPFRAEVSFRSEPPVSPVAVGRFLEPSTNILVEEKGRVVFNWNSAFLSDRKNNYTFTYRIMAGIKPIERRETAVARPGTVVSFKHTLGPLTLPKGEYPLDIEVSNGVDAPTKYYYKIVVVPKQQQKPFGAYYTNLEYGGLTHVVGADGKLERLRWDEAWNMGPGADVAVHFPGGFDMVFWRGASFIPMWAIGNTAMTYEWVEAAMGVDGANDCVEPLQDKECRNSRVRILSSTPARTIVHWRYAETDMDYKIIKDEWIDEYYTLYPDGYGTRKVVGWLGSGRWHETNEMIVVLPAGKHPFDALAPNAVSIFGDDGKRVDVDFPDPSLSMKFKQPAMFRVRLKDTPLTPVMATRKLMGVQRVYDGWQRRERYVSPSYWGDHWPLTRGLPTTQYVPEGWKERPAHASLMALIHEPDETKSIAPGRERVVWSWLIGLTGAGDEAFKAQGNAWLKPVKAEARDGVYWAAWNAQERAYVVRARPGAKSLKVSFHPAPGEALRHPAFLFEGFAPARIKAQVDSKPIAPAALKYGVESGFTPKRGVLFINADIVGPAVFQFDALP